MTVDLVVAPSHIQALTQAAAQAKLTLRGYIAEIIEAHAAALLLPSVRASGGKAGGAVTRAEPEDTDLGSGPFPWPGEVYHVHPPRSGS